MRSFFHDYSYSMIKMFVNQFAISIFGAVIAMATTSSNNDVITVFFSIFAILFYMFLIYNMTWEIGAKDRISVDTGRKKYAPYTGLVISLFANAINFLVAIVYAIGYPFMASEEWAGSICAIMRVVSIFINGMYLGVITVFKVGELQLNHYWWTYFAIIVPALVTSWVAYYIGFKNWKFSSLFAEKTPSQTQKK